MRFLSIFFAILLFTTAVFAQNADNSAMMDRLNQIQRQMDVISRQVYSGNPPPQALSNPGMAGGDNAGLAAAVDERISNLEGSLRQINNRLDEQDYALGQLKSQFDLYKSDQEARMKESDNKNLLDNATSRAASEQAAAQPASTTPAATPTDKTAQPAAAATDSTAADNNGAVKELPSDNAAALYDSSFQLLREQKYPQAQNGFNEFLKKFPTDTLAGNAQYWLGETYYAQGNYVEAAKIFAQGYKKYPKSSKAPDNLLKLGLSLSQSGKKQDACLTLQQLATQYPNSAAVIKQRAGDEAKKLNCGAPVNG